MKKIAAIIVAVIALIGGLLAYLSASQNATLNRPVFDGFDKKRLNQAYKQMFRDSLSGKADIEGKTDEELDAELIARYHAMG